MSMGAERDSEGTPAGKRGRRFLVTGASGFVGSHVVRELSKAGHEVIPMIRGTATPPALEPWAGAIRRASLQDPAALEKAVSGVDVVVHLGAPTRARSEAEFMDTNAEGVARLVTAVRAANGELSRFVYVSSIAAGGPSSGATPVREEDAPRPVSPYGRSKLAGETRLRENAGQVPWTILRPPLVYGPGERDLLMMFRSAARGWVPLLGGGDRSYSIVHARDLVAAIVAVTQSPGAAGQTYYVAEDRVYRGRDLLGHIAAALGSKPRIVPVPRWIAAIVASAGSGLKPIMKRPPFLTMDKLPELVENWVCSPDKLARDCGFRCGIPFDQGAAETAAWYRAEKWL